MFKNLMSEEARAGWRSRGKRVFQSMPIAAVLAAIIVLYLLTGFSFGSTSGGPSYGKDRAVAAALEHISEQYPGAIGVELARASRGEGVWSLTFRCVLGTTGGAGATGRSTTIRLSVDEGSLRVWGFSTDGW